MKIKTFSIAVSFIIVMSTSYHLKSQDTTGAEVNTKRYIQANFAVGYLRSTNHNFNEELERQGYKGLDPNMLNGSLSVDFFFNARCVVSTKGYFFNASGPKQPNNFECSLDGYGFEMIFGYILAKRDSWRLYPFVGLSANTAIFRLYNPDGQYPNTIDDFIANPVNVNMNLATVSFTRDIGLSFDKILELKRKKLDCPQSTRYLTVGLKVGYYYSGQSKLRRLDVYNLNGFYANLFIGMGTKIRKVRWK